ncbi:calcium lipid binding protein, putative [Ricinus communis]|uniref:Calcium lipid binding protein, putative n=1 Tax=Ricinus communis TaxID=3988 RepID=B9R8B6_RICCO|nr:calcium lipid binding protein, putative [Ricinus communis]
MEKHHAPKRIFSFKPLRKPNGTSIGITIGYYMFIYFQPTDVKDPVIRPLVEQDSKTLQRMLPELPLWVKNPDYDRVDWLNRFIATMWPYLDTAICKTVKTIAKPIIAEQIPKYKIDSVEFQELTLGSLPPTFQGIKVYITDEKELIIEPSLKWAGNPNIIIAAKAFGLRATVQVVDLQVFAAPRITLKPLVPTFPCFASIFVSLMEKPHVDFGLKLLGADVMSIPGLYRFVQELIKDQVANMYLWPKALQVPILDPAKAAKRPVGILSVKVVRAMKLKKKDFLGASDPYVKLKLTEDKLPSKKTAIKHKNLNPEWNEEFNIVVKDPESQALEVIVYDWEQVGKHEKMGMNVVPLKELTPDEPKVMTLDLLKNMDPNDAQNEKSRGQLVLELIYKPFKEDEMPNDVADSNDVGKAPEGTPAGGGLLVVIVHEAQDIEGKHHTNPYVRLLFRGEEKRTKLVKKNRDPRWEEEFQFTLEEPPTNDRIYVEVLSASSRMGILHPKENLGYVTINLADVVNNKRTNEKYHLIDSRNGRIQIELQWRTSS